MAAGFTIIKKDSQVNTVITTCFSNYLLFATFICVNIKLYSLDLKQVDQFYPRFVYASPSANINCAMHRQDRLVRVPLFNPLYAGFFLAFKCFAMLLKALRILHIVCRRRFKLSTGCLRKCFDYFGG